MPSLTEVPTIFSRHVGKNAKFLLLLSFQHYGLSNVATQILPFCLHNVQPAVIPEYTEYSMQYICHSNES